MPLAVVIPRKAATGVVAALFPLALLVGATGMFVHAGEEVRRTGAVAGAVAALLAAYLAFAVLPGGRVIRLVLAGATLAAGLVGLTLGTASAVDRVAQGRGGTAAYPFLVMAEGIYLEAIPEAPVYREERRREHLARARLVRALHSCDEGAVLVEVEDALARFRRDGRWQDPFVGTVVGRFVEEGWCTPDLWAKVERRVAAWTTEVRPARAADGRRP